MSSPGNLDRKLLLEIARQALYAAVERRESPKDLPQDAALEQCHGAFVTLRKRGRLRGCIGQVGTGRRLAEVVAHCSKAAALEDPRFDPVRPDELGEIEIEISALSPLRPIAADEIVAGKHGLLVSRGLQRGLLLPQVATEMRWSGQRLLEETCVKAGLEPDAWRDAQTKIEGFTAEVLSESELREGNGPSREDRAQSNYSIST